MDYVMGMQETPKKGLFAMFDKKTIVWFAAVAVFLLAVILLVVFLVGDQGMVYPVQISEVLASNTRYPNGDGRCCDYIELFNSADYDVWVDSSIQY